MDLEVVRTIGRIIFGLFFVYSGLLHLVLARAALASVAKAKGLPAGEAGVVLTGIQLLAGGLSMVFAYHLLIGAALVALFLVLVNFTIHRFWEEEGMERMNDQVQFTKNMALFGAALFFMR